MKRNLLLMLLLSVVASFASEALSEVVSDEKIKSMIVDSECYIDNSRATGSGVFWPGQVGMGCLTTINYIGPMSVSFQGVQVFEIPCTHAIPPSGYFATNYTGRLTHDESAGAGWLHTIGSDNYWTHDEAGRDEPYEDWSAGTLEWKIPIGWRRLRYEGDSTLKAFEAERVKLRDEESRAMIIGGSEDSYKQKYTIESSGVSSVEKFGYRLSRSRWSISGEVTRIEE